MGSREQTGDVLRLIDRTLTFMAGVDESSSNPYVTSFMAKQSSSEPGIYQQMVDLYLKMIPYTAKDEAGQKVKEAREKYAGDYIKIKYMALKGGSGISEAEFDATFHSLFRGEEKSGFYIALMAAHMYSERNMQLIEQYFVILFDGFDQIVHKHKSFFDDTFLVKLNSLDAGFVKGGRTCLGKLIVDLEKVCTAVSSIEDRKKEAATWRYLGAIEHSLAWLRYLILAEDFSDDSNEKLYFVKSWKMKFWKETMGPLEAKQANQSGVYDQATMALFKTRGGVYIFKHTILGTNGGYKPENYNFSSFATYTPQTVFTKNLISHEELLCQVIGDPNATGEQRRFLLIKDDSRLEFFLNS
jgi:hypothetical protein